MLKYKKTNVEVLNLILIIVAVFSSAFNCVAQNDSIHQDFKRKFHFEREIFPIGMITLGSALNYSNFRYFIKKGIGNTTNIKLDNYIQYAPIAELYIADLAGIKHKNSIWNQTKYLAISELITSGIVQTLKFTTKVQRPNGASFSFPSGHTSNAFCSATALYQEFRDTNMPIAISGFGFSTATGILRITNNRHWISDVLAGAGFGILVTDLVYYWEPLKNWNPFKVSKKFAFEPSLNFEGDGVLIGMKIKL